MKILRVSTIAFFLLVAACQIVEGPDIVEVKENMPVEENDPLEGLVASIEPKISMEEQRVYFRNHLPRLLSGFHVKVLKDAGAGYGGHAEPLSYTYEIQCKDGAVVEAILAERGSNEETGENYWSSPVALRCKETGETLRVFDSRHQGYDGENGFTDWMPPATGKFEVLKSVETHEKILLTFHYPEDLFELTNLEQNQTGEAEGPRPENMFTWFTVSTLRGDGSVEIVYEEECA